MTDTRFPAISSAQVPVPGTTIRFFISSTFADFQIERDVLQKLVFPDLRKLCANSGFQLQPIDLRWGVSEAAGTDRQTLRICFDELERCRQPSPDFFLLILLGERYGSYILPPQIPSTLVEHLLPYLTGEERDQFRVAYRLDENAVPPEYVLLRTEGPERVEDEGLRVALSRAGHAAGVGEAERLLFDGSATHREIQMGLLGEPSEARREAGVLCAVRTFAGTPVGPASDDYAAQDADRTTRARLLTNAVVARLPEKQVMRYAVAWDGELGPAFDEAALKEVYLGLLQPKLEAVIAARTATWKAIKEAGRDAAALANAQFEAKRVAHVVDREAELALLAAYLAGSHGVRQPLIVAGAPGSGKSTLLAEAVSRTAVTQPRAALITRYIGVTPGTESLSALLNGLRRAIAEAYGRPEPAPLTDENQLVGTFASELATLSVPPERPLLLVMDSLDQLSTNAIRTDWLPRQLAPQVQVVVSVLAERSELGYLRAGRPAEQVITLAPLSREAGRAVLGQLLAETPERKLTSMQESAVLDAFAIQGLPLFLRLLVDTARHWHSFDLPQMLDNSQRASGPTSLPTTIPNLLETLLSRLENPARHGQALVARAMGNLAAARDGLAEDELLDLLARDEVVRETQKVLSPTSPPIAPHLPLPAALWARLHADIAPLLSERQQEEISLFTFYHQQFRLAVEARYLAGAEELVRHKALATYFAGQQWQPGPETWNWRKLRELVLQQERAEDRTGGEMSLEGLADALEQARQRSWYEYSGILQVIGTLGNPGNPFWLGRYAQVKQRVLRLQLAMVREVGSRTEGMATIHLTGDRRGEGNTLTGLGDAAQELGHPEDARSYYEQALVIHREVGNRAEEGTTLNNLGFLADELGQPVAAREYFEQALVIHREVGNKDREGTTLNNLGAAATDLAQPDMARHYYEQALLILRQVGDRGGEGTTLANLGSLANALGRAEEARQYFDRALLIFREVGNRAGEGTLLAKLGTVAHDLAQSDEAARYYEQALVIFREIGNRKEEGTTLANLGAVATDLAQPDAARHYYEQALMILRQVGDRGGEGTTLANLGGLANALERPQEARKYYEQALVIFREIGNRAEEGTTLASLGAVANDLGRPEAAREYLEEALVIHREVGNRAEEGATLYNLGTMVYGLEQPDEARSYIEQALVIFEEIGAENNAQVAGAMLAMLRYA
jgi:tetratricopeptide (TPR) repeat protein